MTAKEFLLRAWQIDKRIESRIEERERIQGMLIAPRTAKLTGMPRGGGVDWTNAVMAIADMDSAIAKEIGDLCTIKRQVNDAIEAVEDMRYKRILELRYRNYMTWEAIADITGYTLRNVYELHGKALLCVKVPMEKDCSKLH